MLQIQRELDETKIVLVRLLSSPTPTVPLPLPPRAHAHLHLSFFPPPLQHKTIDSVLARGEKLDTLVAKSSDLSMASQVCLQVLICF